MSGNNAVRADARKRREAGLTDSAGPYVSAERKVDTSHLRRYWRFVGETTRTLYGEIQVPSNGERIIVEEIRR